MGIVIHSVHGFIIYILRCIEHGGIWAEDVDGSWCLFMLFLFRSLFWRQTDCNVVGFMQSFIFMVAQIGVYSEAICHFIVDIKYIAFLFHGNQSQGIKNTAIWLYGIDCVCIGNRYNFVKDISRESAIET